ncbi:unnamed protein product [Acanthoscelides obtectus]|uniref:ENTH domain-containing protein n=1 Tax=Acanthoscelides obtectus TaxID=200917 RepID=A0A9P0KLS8_ACAOB|nr:unnamed protein product [Acanthoscelides obtectus]CAK1665183.1 Phosphatidylinositol-binding clathrin assembly protein LAP [Acanthoscelides obtectus]
MERSQNTSWVVVYKALITTHHLMCYGNERFTQYLASSNVSFQLSNFVDKTGVQSAVGARTGYDMSPFIRRYAKYLNEKALSYRAVAFDFCKVKRGKEEGTLRTMNTENLLKTLPILQNQLDALLEFDCSVSDLMNGVINMCFMLLFRDLIRLFACYNDGVINLLEKYFEMNKKQCREALDLYKKFLIRMDRVAEFLKVAENIGIDKGDIPDLTRAPNSLLDALEAHLASLEGNTPTTTSNQKSLKSGVSALSHTSNSFGGAVDDTFKQAALAEEEQMMNNFKASVASPVGGAATNPFLSDDEAPAPPPQTKAEQILDLFGDGGGMTQTQQQPSQPTNALDDLLSLGMNPFADFGATVQGGAPAAPQANGTDFFASTNAPPMDASQSQQSNMWMGGDFTQQAQTGFPQTVGNGGANMGNLFGQPEQSVFDPMGGKPPMQQTVQPQPQAQPTRPPQPAKILTGDLESSLTSLVENLTMDSGNKGQQWNSPKKMSTGGGMQGAYKPPTQQMVGQQPMMVPGQPMQGQPMMGISREFEQPFTGSPKIAQAAPPNQEVTFDPFGAL